MRSSCHTERAFYGFDTIDAENFETLMIWHAYVNKACETYASQ